jgi:hypothetical protein
LYLSLKNEAVIEDYVKKNKKIAADNNLSDVAGLRVTGGLWSVVRYRYFFITFYLLYGVLFILS